MSHLCRILCECKEIGEPRYLAASVMLDKINSVEHEFSAHTFSFHSDFDTEEPYIKYNQNRKHKLSFLVDLQSQLISAKAIMRSHSFVSPYRSLVMTGVKALHVDITPHIFEYPSARMGVKIISQCIQDKVGRKVNDILGEHTAFCLQLLEFHVHYEVKEYMPLPRHRSRVLEEKAFFSQSSLFPDSAMDTNISDTQLGGDISLLAPQNNVHAAGQVTARSRFYLNPEELLCG